MGLHIADPATDGRLRSPEGPGSGPGPQPPPPTSSRPPPARRTGTRRPPLNLGKWWGIEVRAGGSWLLVVLLVVWSFWERFTGAGRHTVAAAFAMAVVAAAAFFASVLAHELVHALEARHRGLRVRGITLYLFGGVTEITSEARRARDELALTAVGPYTSLVLGAGLGLVAYGANLAGLGQVAEIAGLVAWINLALALFNLLPGAPLDGGGILRAIVWRVTGDRTRAGMVAARAGRALGALVVAVGLLEIFFVLGGFVAGLWLVFAGWFLMWAALGEEARVELVAFLAGRRADSLPVDEPEAVAPDTSLAWVVHSQFRRHPVEAVPVDEGGRTVGIVRVQDVARVSPEERFGMTAGQVMRPLDQVARVAAGDDASAVLEAMPDSGLVAITEGDTVVGLIAAPQLGAALERLRLLEGTVVTGAGDR